MKRGIIVGAGIVLITGLALLFNKEEEKVLIDEEVTKNNSLVFMIEQDGEYTQTDTLPAEGYVLNASKSTCSNNATPTWENNRLYLSNLNKSGTSCYLYFDEPCSVGATACEAIVANNPTLSDERGNGVTGPLTEDTTGTLFTAPDDYGTSLIFAGDIDNNWVSFGGYYWRIIRINGDGSIRMIYSGEDIGSVTDANRTGEGTQIGTSAFNEKYDDNAYVGYMYGTPGSDTYEETHANINDSTIKTVIDNWYQTNLTSYSSYLSTEAGFCNDRQPMSGVNSSYGTLGYGTNATSYAAWGRLYENNSWKVTQTPSLKCIQSNDLFTVNSSSKGNRNLTYPVGLITADEVLLAGGFGGSDNSDYYLCTGQYYWTMSPSNFNMNGNASIYSLSPSGNLYGTRIDGVRPVINLRADVTLTGNGTSSNPYTVEGAV